MRNIWPLILVLCLAAFASSSVAHAQDAATPTPALPVAPPAPAQTDIAPAAGLTERFEAELAQIPAGDLNARFDLAMWAYRQYDPKLLNTQALELARGELQRLVERTPSHPHAQTMLRVIESDLASARKRLTPDWLTMFFAILGGVGIFLLGMKNLSEGMQAISGQTLRRMITAVTDNRLIAVGVGTGVTCVIQSSSITTVIVVGLVNSGVMLLHQAIGVIMGANIGTTITGWILVLNIGKYGLPILGIAVFFWLFSRKDRPRYIALAVMGLGMVFFGLEMMKNGFEPMKDVPAFKEAFAWFDATTYFGVLKCVAVGCIVTLIVQSSSATLGITIGLASTGVIPFDTAAALVLGENIGTTITAWLASIGATTVAKRAAWAHVLFNVIGVAWITTVFHWYLPLIGEFVEMFDGHNPIGATLANSASEAQYATVVTAGIAAVHSGFNILNTLFFLPFVRIYSRFLERIIPDKGIKEAPHLTSLDIRLVESPIIAIERSRAEILKLGDGTLKMMDWTGELLGQDTPDQALVRKIFHREEIMDNVEQEIIRFLTEMLTGTVPHEVAEEGREQLRIADEFESISDYIASVVKQHLRLRNTGMRLTPAEHQRRMELHNLVRKYVQFIIDALREQHKDILTRAHTDGEIVTHLFKDLREAHLQKLILEKVDPVLSMSYMTMLNDYRKIKDHAQNIAEAMAGRK